MPSTVSEMPETPCRNAVSPSPNTEMTALVMSSPVTYVTNSPPTTTLFVADAANSASFVQMALPIAQ